MTSRMQSRSAATKVVAPGVTSALPRNRHNILPHKNLFAPRLGIAYRVTNNTVIRTGFGIFFSPGDDEQNASPYAAPINSSGTLCNATQDGGRTAVNLLNNPYPNDVPQPTGHGHP